MHGIIDFYNRHPKLVAWVVLAVGMVAILLWSAKDVGLLPQQSLALVIATIGLAGLCVWIIGWEDDEEETGEDQAAPASEPAPENKS
jgi:predicted tellurium resistance membrane protein TerC